MEQKQSSLSPAEQRDLKVCKTNDLILHSRFYLSTVEQKIVNYVISKVNICDVKFQTYDFSIREFCDVCGITATGNQYDRLKKIIQNICNKSAWIKLDDGTETIVRWIDKPYINKDDGVIKIKIDEDMRPFLLNLRGEYAQYELIWILRFKSKYSIRLYETIKALHYDELHPFTWTYTLENLRKVMGVENGKYEDWRDFRKRVLDVAVKEINTYSDKHLTYDNVMRGRNVTGIVLHIAPVDSIERLVQYDENNEVLDGQTSLFEGD